MSPVPKIFESTPEPKITIARYHGQSIPLWEGKVHFEKISGWQNNPRIELALKRWKLEYGNREITQDDLFEIMKTQKDVKLRELRDNIQQNGLRKPIVLTWDGKLLDGNRRFFATRYALDGLDTSAPSYAQLQFVPAFVLPQDTTKDSEELILVEENFAPSLKEEWPDYVKATWIKKARREDGLNPKQIAEKFGWNPGKIRETIRALEIIDDFVSFATSEADPEKPGGGGLGIDETEAEKFVSEKYQFFNEAQKSLWRPLMEDESSFKEDFYGYLHADKFASFPEVRIAHQAWENEEAKERLEFGGKSAGKDAKAVVDYHKRVIRGEQQNAREIERFVRFLFDLKSEQLQRLSQETLRHLESALRVTLKMALAAQGKQSDDSDHDQKSR